MGKNRKGCGCGGGESAGDPARSSPANASVSGQVTMKAGRSTMTRIGNKVFVGQNAFPEVRESFQASFSKSALVSRTAPFAPSNQFAAELRSLPQGEAQLSPRPEAVDRSSTFAPHTQHSKPKANQRIDSFLGLQQLSSSPMFLTNLDVPLPGAGQSAPSQSVFLREAAEASLGLNNLKSANANAGGIEALLGNDLPTAISYLPPSGLAAEAKTDRAPSRILLSPAYPPREYAELNKDTFQGNLDCEKSDIWYWTNVHLHWFLDFGKITIWTTTSRRNDATRSAAEVARFLSAWLNEMSSKSKVPAGTDYSQMIIDEIFRQLENLAKPRPLCKNTCAPGMACNAYVELSELQDEQWYPVQILPDYVNLKALGWGSRANGTDPNKYYWEVPLLYHVHYSAAALFYFSCYCNEGGPV